MCSCDLSVKFQNEELFRPREEWARAKMEIVGRGGR